MLGIQTDLDTWGRIGLIAERNDLSVDDLIPKLLEKGLSFYEKSNIREIRAKSKHKNKETEQKKVAPCVLTEEMKGYIKENIILPTYDIGVKLGVKRSAVAEYKKFLITAYVKGDGKEESVTSISAKFRVPYLYVSRIKKSVGSLRPRKFEGLDLSMLGTKEEILFALTRGGKSNEDLIREHNLKISRQGLEMALAKRLGISVGSNDRTAEWYARRISLTNDDLFKKLCDRNQMEKSLLKSTLIEFSAELGISKSILKTYLEKHLGINTGNALSTNKQTELVCSNPKCIKPGGKFFRRTATVRRDREKNPGKPVFCSRKCFGQNNGNTSGFGAHPENARHPKKK